MADEPQNPSSSPQAEVRTPLRLPEWFASTFLAYGTAAELTLVAGRALPFVGADGALNQHHVINDPIGTIHMSVHTAKELAHLLGDIVSKLEDKYGVVTTECLKAELMKK
jgi:hypothetical protein